MTHLLGKLEQVRQWIYILNNIGVMQDGANRSASESEQHAIVGMLSVLARDPACRPAIMAGFRPLIASWGADAANQMKMDLVTAMTAIVNNQA